VPLPLPWHLAGRHLAVAVAELNVPVAFIALRVTGTRHGNNNLMSPLSPVILLLGTLFVTVSGASAPPPAVAQLALLTDAAATQGAVFLDGSPAARYISRGDPLKWIVYQEGVS
jgi:hypothetical protein